MRNVRNVRVVGRAVVTRKHEESDHQILFFTWLALAHPDVRRVTFAIPNGGKRNPREAARLKREGVLAGCPDIAMNRARGGYHGLFIEMKTAKGRLTNFQTIVHTDLQAEGYLVKIARSWEEAREIVEKYLSFI